MAFKGFLNHLSLALLLPRWCSKENVKAWSQPTDLPVRELGARHSQICFVSRPRVSITVCITELQRWYLSFSMGLQLFFSLFRIQDPLCYHNPVLYHWQSLTPLLLLLWGGVGSLSGRLLRKFLESDILVSDQNFDRTLSSRPLIQLWKCTSAEADEMCPFTAPM